MFENKHNYVTSSYHVNVPEVVGDYLNGRISRSEFARVLHHEVEIGMQGLQLSDSDQNQIMRNRLRFERLRRIRR